ncbi:MAG: prepilin-type N-terminal cleavage/methylation domain-containing protein [bacterium]|nr:prepilin-type N-terminal cleavage/methylation domain-containing protein [bacterium]
MVELRTIQAPAKRRRPPRPHRHAHGFTIAEIMIALAVLTIVAYGVYDNLQNTSRLGQQRYERIQAQLLAQQELERLRACPYDALRAWTPPAIVQKLPNHLKFDYRDTVAPRPDGMLDLTVQVGWNMAKGQEFNAANSVTLKGVKAR